MAITYTEESPIAGPAFRCKRCKRVYPYPEAGALPVRCECGWWYRNLSGKIVDEFHPRLAGRGYK